MKQYDYLIVGAGLFGSVFAHEATSKGFSCLVIEKRDHIGGNIYCENIEGINVHKYGAHIFHTSDKAIWDYVTQFADFHPFFHTPIARYKDEVFNLPFNMNTFSRLWQICTPEEAQNKIREEIAKGPFIDEPKNLEEQALKNVGRTVYEKLIRGYTEKHWGRSCDRLPPFILKRIPLRFTYDNNYYNDTFQGIPVGGYNVIIEKLLEGSDVLLHTGYSEFIGQNPNIAKKTVYTGNIDRFFNYCLGQLQYRTLKFEHKVLDCENFQGTAVVNYTEREVPYTRIIEHKHFEASNQPKTVLTYEYPQEWTPETEPYYPINDEENNELYRKYREMADDLDNIIFGGRLGEYRYFDMDEVIKSALETAEKEFGSKSV